MSPTLHIHLLGDFLLLADDQPLTTVHVPRLQSLLAYLVLHCAAPQSRAHLAFLLWPDSTDAQAHVNLRKALHHLRQALPRIDDFLHTDRQRLHWQPACPAASWTLDVQIFEQSLATAQQAEQAQDMPRLRQSLEQAVSLYHADLLPGCYDEWILPERERIRQLFLRAAERLLALMEHERDYTAAIALAQRLLRYDALQETLYCQLMRCYSLRGDRAAALRVYHTCVTVLERELATGPSEATRQVYEALLRVDTSSSTTPVPLMPRGTAIPLVGRKPEWGQLQAAWRRAISGQPHMVLLVGEAGIGKTRLAEEMLTWVARQGMASASAHCYAMEGPLAYAPLREWLRSDVVQLALPVLPEVWLSEVARLMPDLLTRWPNLIRSAAMTESGQRQHFFESLAHALLDARQPLLLLLDDLQWCDGETVEWLHYLLRFAARARLLLVATIRVEEILPGHPLLAFLGALQRDGLVTEIALGPLAVDETTMLAEHIMGQPMDTLLLNALQRETEGNPLFVVEMLRAGTWQPSGNAQPLTSQRLSLLTQPGSTLPPTVQSVLATRLAQLSPPARELANVAAVIGREFAFNVLAHASGEQEETIVRGLDELWQRRIVREQGAGTSETYDFSHDKLREHTYAALSPAHLRQLHRCVAAAFAKVYNDDLDSVSLPLAIHYERAGLPELAIPCYQRAGEAAMRISANTEAISLLERAAALLATGLAGNTRRKQLWQIEAQVCQSLGSVFALIGQLQQARQAYLHATTVIPVQEYIWQACLQRQIANTWQFASDNPQASRHVKAREAFQLAECILAQAAVTTSKEWLHEWIHLQNAQLFPLRVSVEEMTAVIERAQPVVELHATAEQRGRFFLALTMRDLARDRYVVAEQTIDRCRATLAAIQPTENKGLIGFTHFALGACLLWHGDLDEADEHLRAALHIGEQLGNATLRKRCLTFLPFILRQRGQVEAVRSLITQMRAELELEAQNSSIIAGHCAWLAWRDGAFAVAESYARSSLEENQQLEQQHINPFRWTGVWILMGIALTQEKIAEAISYVPMLLDPTQQPPPANVLALLEAAQHCWHAGQKQETYTLLQQTIPLARQLGYL